MKVLAIIPARGGSKGIPKKNIVDLNGKPLIQYTLESARQSKKLDRIFLSSDDEEIIGVVEKLGLRSDYKRPAVFASDEASGTDVVLDVLRWLEEKEGYVPDAVMLLQPTSPLRSSEDINGAIERFIRDEKKCLVGVHEMVEHPYECVYNIEQDDWSYLAKQEKNATRRQDYKDKFYYINGALYIVDVKFFKDEKVFIKAKNTSFYIMPHERGIDIDEYSDLKRAEFLVKVSNSENR